MGVFSRLSVFTSVIVGSFVAANFADARVCFIIGQCDQKTSAENCNSLGYRLKASDCASPYVPVDECISNGEKWYRACSCAKEYIYQKETGEFDPYEYGQECEGLYNKKICKREYQYVNKPSVSDPDSKLDSLNDNLRVLGFNNPVSYCGNNSQIDDSEVCIEKYKNDMMSRYKACACDTEVYKWKVALSGANAEIFVPENECKGSDNIKYYAQMRCSGDVSNTMIGNYTYRSQCNDDTEVPEGSVQITSEISSNSFTCYACKSRCLTLDACKAQIYGNKGHYCHKLGENCYEKKTGGVCSIDDLNNLDSNFRRKFTDVINIEAGEFNHESIR